VSPIANVDAFARRSSWMLCNGWYFLGLGGSLVPTMVACAPVLCAVAVVVIFRRRLVGVDARSGDEGRSAGSNGTVGRLNGDEGETGALREGIIGVVIGIIVLTRS